LGTLEVAVEGTAGHTAADTGLVAVEVPAYEVDDAS